MRARIVLFVVVALCASLTGVASAAPLGLITETTSGLEPADSSIPYGMVEGADGNIWFADQGSTKAIGRVTPGGTVKEFSTGLQPSNGSQPQLLTAGPDGNVWFTDAGGTLSKIGRITPDGTITEFVNGLQANNHSAPFGIAPGADGNVWFTDGGMIHAVGKITPDGTITEYSVGLNPGAMPFLIAPGPDGNMWFTDNGTTKAIGEITPDGTFTEFPLPAGSIPFDLTAGPDGNMWFTDEGSTKAIGRITPLGTVTEFSTGLPVTALPYAIVPGPDGDLWFTDAGNGPVNTGIGRIDPHTGQITEWTAGLQGTNGNKSTPFVLTPGANGSIWFSDQGTGAGSFEELGQIGTGAPAASVRAPSVTGSGEQGTQQVCQGDQWSPWAGQLPFADAQSWDGFTWLRDGRAISGATGPSYTPIAGDVGHSLACTVTVTYPLMDTTVSSTSATVTVIPPGAGATGPTGGTGPTGATGPKGDAGPQGPAGQVELVTCKTVTRTVKHGGKTHKVKKLSCTTKLVSGPVKFKTARVHASLMRRGAVYATGDATIHGSRVRAYLMAARSLTAGRYTLVVAAGSRVLARRLVSVG
jgi:streptogramin lyase